MLRHLSSISLIMLLPSLVSSFRCPPPKQPAFFAAGTGVCLWCAAAAASAVVDVDIDTVAAAAEPSWFGKVAMQPGFKLEYEEYMDAAGNIRSAPSKVQSTSSTWLLLLVAGATRFGGILPDELPFNIVQKLLRLIPGVNAILPDLKDSDPRKAYQDTWYGTDISASLPKAMRSRTGPVTPSPPSDEDAEREREGAAGAGAKDAIAKESVEMVSNDEIS